MELLPGALTSSQWAVKAQAARALGTVAKKLGANIQYEIQVSTAQQYIVQYTLVLYSCTLVKYRCTLEQVTLVQVCTTVQWGTNKLTQNVKF